MSSGFLYRLVWPAISMQLPTIFPSFQSAVIRLPDFSFMQPQPSSLPCEKCPSYDYISPSSMLMCPLPSIRLLFQHPRQRMCSSTMMMPKPWRLPSWNSPWQTIPSWYSQVPLPCFCPSMISPLNLTSFSSSSAIIANITLVVTLRSYIEVSLSFCMAESSDEVEPYIFTFCCSQFFSNFSCITNYSRDAILLSRVEVALSYSFLGSVWVLTSVFSLLVNASFSASRSNT